MRKISLHFQIMIALGLGLIFAILSIKLGWPASFTVKYIKPFGTIFISSLKAVAVPLVVSSLIVGVTRIEDTAKLSRISSKTLLIYTVTTIIATFLGLFIGNVFKPGKIISEQTRDKLMSIYADKSVQAKVRAKEAKKEKEGPLQIVVDAIPENIFKSLTNSKNLLQVVILSIVFGIGLTKIPSRKNKKVIAFFEGCNDSLIEIIKLIMRIAPIGIFALISSMLIEVAGSSDEMYEVLKALLSYTSTVLLGLFILTMVLYPLIIKLFTKVSIKDFFKGMRPAQLVAFTTSSSNAALPVTMERVEKHLGVSEEVSSFVLPLGATVNMDGGAVYQGISVLFIAQVLGIELSITSQIVIVVQVVLGSVGTAGVPSASVVTLAMILESIGIPAAGLALIFAPERILDMCRTTTNITGDAVVAVVVASSEGELSEGADEHLLGHDEY